MKKAALITAVSLVALAFALAPAYAGKGKKSDTAGKSDTAHEYLYEKDQVTWDIVEDGAWGKLTYTVAAPEFDFVFNGHGLVAGTEYVLAYYPDPWPGNGLICLGGGVANRGGNLNIGGSANTGDLPANGDPFAKVWLALAADVDCDNALFVGWHGADYRFEYNGVTFDDTDE